MRKLQARLILNDDGDKVIFRLFGGDSSLRTWKVDTRPSVPTNLILVVGSSHKPRNCVRTMIKDS